MEIHWDTKMRISYLSFWRLLLELKFATLGVTSVKFAD